jgi:pyruvate formate lyase activating enzyme
MVNQPDRQHQGTVIDIRYWHARPDGRVQCDVCPRACRMHEGQRGLCFVRGVEDGRVKLFTYGRSSGFCVDPIEKKPLNHFLPGSAVLSFGTAGCNLACKFCQNWDMSKSREMDTLADRASPSELAAAAERLGCASIAYTYNDPTVFMEYAIDVAPSDARGRLHYGMACVTFTRATCATPKAPAPGATRVGPR